MLPKKGKAIRSPQGEAAPTTPTMSDGLMESCLLFDSTVDSETRRSC